MSISSNDHSQIDLIEAVYSRFDELSDMLLGQGVRNGDVPNLMAHILDILLTQAGQGETLGQVDDAIEAAVGQALEAWRRHDHPGWAGQPVTEVERSLVYAVVFDSVVGLADKVAGPSQARESESSREDIAFRPIKFDNSTSYVPVDVSATYLKDIMSCSTAVDVRPGHSQATAALNGGIVATVSDDPARGSEYSGGYVPTALPLDESLCFNAVEIWPGLPRATAACLTRLVEETREAVSSLLHRRVVGLGERFYARATWLHSEKG